MLYQRSGEDQKPEKSKDSSRCRVFIRMEILYEKFTTRARGLYQNIKNMRVKNFVKHKLLLYSDRMVC